jgi:hypothetical protein
MGLLYQPWMIDGDDSGASGGMNEWQKMPKYSEETLFSRATLPTSDATWLNRDRTRAAAVGSRLPTSWTKARPIYDVTNYYIVMLTGEWEMTCSSVRNLTYFLTKDRLPLNAFHIFVCTLISYTVCSSATLLVLFEVQRYRENWQTKRHVTYPRLEVYTQNGGGEFPGRLSQDQLWGSHKSFLPQTKAGNKRRLVLVTFAWGMIQQHKADLAWCCVP